MNSGKDWKKWHTLYDDDQSGLAKRLRLVQDAIANSLPNDVLIDNYQIIDICAGDGRDLIEVLAHYPEKDHVHSLLVEIDERLATSSEKAASNANIQNVTVYTGDASVLATYRNVAAADLILLCGIFGNISNEDIEKTIKSLAQLSKQGTRVIWTRHLRQPSVVPEIRNYFINHNFKELDYKTTADQSYAVVTCEFHGSPQPLNHKTKMFTFIK